MTAELKKLEKQYGRPGFSRALSRQTGGTVAQWSNKTTIPDVSVFHL